MKKALINHAMHVIWGIAGIAFGHYFIAALAVFDGGCKIYKCFAKGV